MKNSFEALGLGIASGLLIAGVVSTGIDNLPRPQNTPVSRPLDGWGERGQSCDYSTQALEDYLLEGFKESTGFDWMRTKGIKTQDMNIFTSCSTLQGRVAVEVGVNLRGIPYVNDAFLKGALNFGDPVDFHHVIWIGKEAWGARGADDGGFEFFIIKIKNGTEFIKVKNLQEPFPNNGNGKNQQNDLLHGRSPLAAHLRRQPPNVGRVRTGGRVFVA